MSLEFHQQVSTVVKRKKAWKRIVFSCHDLQSNSAPFLLLDHHRIGELHLNGRSPRTVNVLSKHGKKQSAVAMSNNGKYIVGGLSTGHLFLWNVFANTAHNIPGPPPAADDTGKAKSRWATFRSNSTSVVKNLLGVNYIHVSDDADIIVVVTVELKLWLWIRDELDTPSEKIVGSEESPSISGRWFHVNGSPLCLAKRSFISAIDCQITSDPVLGRCCQILHSFLRVHDDDSKGELVMAFLKISLAATAKIREDVVEYPGMISGETLAASVHLPMHEIRQYINNESEFESVDMGPILVHWDPFGSLAAVAVNSRYNSSCQLFYVSALSSKSVSMNLGAMIQPSLPAGAVPWVQSLSWSHDGLLLAVAFRNGSLTILNRLGEPLHLCILSDTGRVIQDLNQALIYTAPVEAIRNNSLPQRMSAKWHPRDPMLLWADGFSLHVLRLFELQTLSERTSLICADSSALLAWRLAVSHPHAPADEHLKKFIPSLVQFIAATPHPNELVSTVVKAVSALSWNWAAPFFVRSALELVGEAFNKLLRNGHFLECLKLLNDVECFFNSGILHTIRQPGGPLTINKNKIKLGIDSSVEPPSPTEVGSGLGSDSSTNIWLEPMVLLKRQRCLLALSCYSQANLSGISSQGVQAMLKTAERALTPLIMAEVPLEGVPELIKIRQILENQSRASSTVAMDSAHLLFLEGQYVHSNKLYRQNGTRGLCSLFCSYLIQERPVEMIQLVRSQLISLRDTSAPFDSDLMHMTPSWPLATRVLLTLCGCVIEDFLQQRPITVPYPMAVDEYLNRNIEPSSQLYQSIRELRSFTLPFNQFTSLLNQDKSHLDIWSMLMLFARSGQHEKAVTALSTHHEPLQAFHFASAVQGEWVPKWQETLLHSALKSNDFASVMGMLVLCRDRGLRDTVTEHVADIVTAAVTALVSTVKQLHPMPVSPSNDLQEQGTELKDEKNGDSQSDSHSDSTSGTSFPLLSSFASLTVRPLSGETGLWRRLEAILERLLTVFALLDLDAFVEFLSHPELDHEYDALTEPLQQLLNVLWYLHVRGQIRDHVESNQDARHWTARLLGFESMLPKPLLQDVVLTYLNATRVVSTDVSTDVSEVMELLPMYLYPIIPSMEHKYNRWKDKLAMDSPADFAFLEAEMQQLDAVKAKLDRNNDQLFVEFRIQTVMNVQRAGMGEEQLVHARALVSSTVQRLTADLNQSLLFWATPSADVDEYLTQEKQLDDEVDREIERQKEQQRLAEIAALERRKHSIGSLIGSVSGTGFSSPAITTPSRVLQPSTVLSMDDLVLPSPALSSPQFEEAVENNGAQTVEAKSDIQAVSRTPSQNSLYEVRRRPSHSEDIFSTRDPLSAVGQPLRRRTLHLLMRANSFDGKPHESTGDSVRRSSRLMVDLAEHPSRNVPADLPPGPPQTPPPSGTATATDKDQQHALDASAISSEQPSEQPSENTSAFVNDSERQELEMLEEIRRVKLALKTFFLTRRRQKCRDVLSNLRVWCQYSKDREAQLQQEKEQRAARREKEREERERKRQEFARLQREEMQRLLAEERRKEQELLARQERQRLAREKFLRDQHERMRLQTLRAQERVEGASIGHGHDVSEDEDELVHITSVSTPEHVAEPVSESASEHEHPDEGVSLSESDQRAREEEIKAVSLKIYEAIRVEQEKRKQQQQQRVNRPVESAPESTMERPRFDSDFSFGKEEVHKLFSTLADLFVNNGQLPADAPLHAAVPPAVPQSTHSESVPVVDQHAVAVSNQHSRLSPVAENTATVPHGKLQIEKKEVDVQTVDRSYESTSSSEDDSGELEPSVVFRKQRSLVQGQRPVQLLHFDFKEVQRPEPASPTVPPASSGYSRPPKLLIPSARPPSGKNVRKTPVKPLRHAADGRPAVPVLLHGSPSTVKDQKDTSTVKLFTLPKQSVSPVPTGKPLLQLLNQRSKQPEVTDSNIVAPDQSPAQPRSGGPYGKISLFAPVPLKTSTTVETVSDLPVGGKIFHGTPDFARLRKTVASTMETVVANLKQKQELAQVDSENESQSNEEADVLQSSTQAPPPHKSEPADDSTDDLSYPVQHRSVDLRSEGELVTDDELSSISSRSDLLQTVSNVSVPVRGLRQSETIPNTARENPVTTLTALPPLLKATQPSDQIKTSSKLIQLRTDASVQTSAGSSVDPTLVTQPVSSDMNRGVRLETPVLLSPSANVTPSSKRFSFDSTDSETNQSPVIHTAPIPAESVHDGTGSTAVHLGGAQPSSSIDNIIGQPSEVPVVSSPASQPLQTVSPVLSLVNEVPKLTQLSRPKSEGGASAPEVHVNLLDLTSPVQSSVSLLGQMLGIVDVKAPPQLAASQLNNESTAQMTTQSSAEFMIIDLKKGTAALPAPTSEFIAVADSTVVPHTTPSKPTQHGTDSTVSPSAAQNNDYVRKQISAFQIPSDVHVHVNDESSSPEQGLSRAPREDQQRRHDRAATLRARLESMTLRIEDVDKSADRIGAALQDMHKTLDHADVQMEKQERDVTFERLLQRADQLEHGSQSMQKSVRENIAAVELMENRIDSRSASKLVAATSLHANRVLTTSTESASNQVELSLDSLPPQEAQPLGRRPIPSASAVTTPQRPKDKDNGSEVSSSVQRTQELSAKMTRRITEAMVMMDEIFKTRRKQPPS